MYNYKFINFCAKLAIFSEKKQGKDTKFDFLMFFLKKMPLFRIFCLSLS